MLSSMGRPKEHGARTGMALLDAAERIVEQEGLGALTVRRVVTEHPCLFRIGVQHGDIGSGLAAEFRSAADDAMTRLTTRLARLQDAGLLGGRAVREAACEFHALCEGLAVIELRGALTRGGEERIWRSALTALVTGFAASSR